MSLKEYLRGKALPQGGWNYLAAVTQIQGGPEEQMILPFHLCPLLVSASALWSLPSEFSFFSLPIWVEY